MAWNEGSFIEGAIAGALGGGAVGATSGVGVGTIPGVILGAIIGAIVKSPMAMILIAGFIIFLSMGISSFITGIPLWIYGILILVLFLLFKRKK